MKRDDEPAGYWTKHYQAAYLDDAANPAYPRPIRVAFLAYGTHKANGHARFKAHEVANVLGEFDTIGTFVPADRFAVNRAIRTAIAWGLLAEGSKALCLVVPATASGATEARPTPRVTATAPGETLRVAATCRPQTLRMGLTLHPQTLRVAATFHAQNPSLLLVPVTRPPTTPQPPPRPG